MSEKCTDCNHYTVCGDNVTDSGCKYEPKRVKCDDGCVKERDEYIDKYDDGNFETRTVKNIYCPVCGTRIEVK